MADYPEFVCRCSRCTDLSRNLTLLALKLAWETHPDPDDMSPFPVRSWTDVLDAVERDVRGEVDAS